MSMARKQIRWNGWGWVAHREPLAEREEAWRWLASELGMPALLATPARALEDLALPAPRLAPETIRQFSDLLGPDRVRQDDYERAFHARGRGLIDLLHLRQGDLSTAPGAVLYPRGEEEVLGILKLAAEQRIAVIPFGGGTGDGVTAAPDAISLDLSGMDRVVEIDTLSGIATVESGITGVALERALNAKGMTLHHTPQDFEFSTLGGWIAAADTAPEWLLHARLATPAGILEEARLASGSRGQLGVITQATVRVQAAVAPVTRNFLFRDFAGGGAAVREALQTGLPHFLLRLCDGEETRFARGLAQAGIRRRLTARLTDGWMAMRRFDEQAALLTTAFPDTASAHAFERLARKLDAQRMDDALPHPDDYFHTPYRHDAMLDRGVGVDRLETFTSWARLPTLHSAVRTALLNAIRGNAPRPGAQGLVLTQLDEARPEGATLRFTTLYPRMLENEIAQARTIRQAGLEAVNSQCGAQSGGVAATAFAGLKQALDPAGILNPQKA